MQQIGGISFGINCRNFQPLKSYQEALDSMKKSRLDLAQLKSGVGAKLQRKRSPLSPASVFSSKKKVVEKEVIEEEPVSTLLEKDNTSPTRKDPPTPFPSVASMEARKGYRVEDAETFTSITPIQPSISTSPLKEKFIEIESFCRSMKSGLLDPPLESSSDIVSRNTNYYRERAEVGILL